MITLALVTSALLAPQATNGEHPPNAGAHDEFPFQISDVSDHPGWSGFGFDPTPHSGSGHEEDTEGQIQVRKYSSHSYETTPTTVEHTLHAWVTHDGTSSPQVSASVNQTTEAIYLYSTGSTERAYVSFRGWVSNPSPEIYVTGHEVHYQLAQDVGLDCSLGAGTHLRHSVEYEKVDNGSSAVGSVDVGLGVGLGPLSISAPINTASFQLLEISNPGHPRSRIEAQTGPNLVLPNMQHPLYAEDEVDDFLVYSQTRLSLNLSLRGKSSPVNHPPGYQHGGSWAPISAGVESSGDGSCGWYVVAANTEPGYVALPVHGSHLFVTDVGGGGDIDLEKDNATGAVTFSRPGHEGGYVATPGESPTGDPDDVPWTWEPLPGGDGGLTISPDEGGVLIQPVDPPSESETEEVDAMIRVR